MHLSSSVIPFPLHRQKASTFVRRTPWRACTVVTKTPGSANAKNCIWRMKKLIAIADTICSTQMHYHFIAFLRSCFSWGEFHFCDFCLSLCASCLSVCVYVCLSVNLCLSVCACLSVCGYPAPFHTDMGSIHAWLSLVYLITAVLHYASVWALLMEMLIVCIVNSSPVHVSFCITTCSHCIVCICR